ncbi:MAG: hypothetical protein ACRDHZ_10060 [Ktedonobacteraceae bacterium]
MRTIGEIIFWNQQKGFGFVEVLKPVAGNSGLEERTTAFCYHADVAERKQLHLGDLITFEPAPSGNPKHPYRALAIRIIRFADSTTSEQPAVEAVQP